MSHLSCLIELRGKDITDFFEAVIKGEGYISFDKNTRLGLYSQYNAGGSGMDIQLEKPFVVPVNMIQRVQI